MRELAKAAGLVWSPLSNLLLYGETADVAAAKRLGIKIALGSDWAPSGSRNLLGELKIARIVSDHWGGAFTNEELVRMVTVTPAQMLGWDRFVGSIEPGKRADLLVLADTVEDPFSQLIGARENQILAVVIDGRPRLGRQGLLEFAPDQQETVRIGGWRYTLDLAEDWGQTLSGLSLATASAKLAYGLHNLSELARDYPKQASFLLERASGELSWMLNGKGWGLDLEFEPKIKSLRAAMERVVEIDLSRLKPIDLPALTEIDDPLFRPSLRANINLPEPIREAL